MSNLTTRQSRVALFQQYILHSLAFWVEHPAIQEINVPLLDRKRESILKTISMGLEMGVNEDEAWSLVYSLMLVFASYMERRGHWDVWHSLLQRSIGVARRVGDTDGEITLTALLARVCQRQSRPKGVIRHYRCVIRLARQAGNRFEEARACSNLGYLYIDEERWWRSEVLSQYALKLFEELDSAHGRAHTHNHLGVLYMRRDQWSEAEKHLVYACNLWDKKEDSHNLIHGLINLGVLYSDMDTPMKALELAENSGEEANLGKILNNLGLAHIEQSNFDKANQYLTKAEKIFQRFSNLQGLAQVWGNIGTLYFRQRKWSSAQLYLAKSLDMYCSLNFRGSIYQLREQLADCQIEIDKHS